MSFESNFKLRKIINPIDNEEILSIGNFIIRQGNVRYHYLYFHDKKDKTKPEKVIQVNPLDEKSISNVMIDEYLRACHGNGDLIRNTLPDFTASAISSVLAEIKGEELYSLNLDTKGIPKYIVETILKDCGIKNVSHNPDDTRFIITEFYPGKDDSKILCILSYERRYL